MKTQSKQKLVFNIPPNKQTTTTKQAATTTTNYLAFCDSLNLLYKFVLCLSYFEKRVSRAGEQEVEKVPVLKPLNVLGRRVQMTKGIEKEECGSQELGGGSWSRDWNTAEMNRQQTHSQLFVLTDGKNSKKQDIRTCCALTCWAVGYLFISHFIFILSCIVIFRFFVLVCSYSNKT